MLSLNNVTKKYGRFTALQDIDLEFSGGMIQRVGIAQAGFLNELTAQATGLPVYAGPVEGTVLGNILSQMLKSGELPDIEAARDISRNSFEIKECLSWKVK